MRKFLISTATMFLSTALTVCVSAQTTGSTSQPPPKTAGSETKTQTASQAGSSSALTTDKDKTSYAIGLTVGKGLHRDAIDVDPNLVVRGMKDALAGTQPLMTDEQVQATMMQLQNQVRERATAKRQQEIESNKKEGDAFLAANKSKPGVTALPSGLQYKVLKEGTGPKPTVDDSVVCNYRGTLIDGKEFDSSYKRGQPATFPVKGVIKGWTEALQLMPVGSKWELYVPPDLAYGERGAGEDIGPNQTLIFEVELLSIAKKDQPESKEPSGKQ